MTEIKTKRLVMTLATLNNLIELEDIEKECNAYFVFDPPCASEHNRSMKECLTIGDIIPDVEEDYTKDNYILYCIWQDDVLIGFLSYYLEYQRKDAVYLSILYIKKTCRGCGIGNEILEALFLKLKQAQFKTIYMHCSLRNAIALQFWVKNGFNHIINIECDGNLFPENFGGIKLMKIL